MGEVRACVYFSVIFLCFQISAAKPFFEYLFCDVFCEDDDGSTTTTASSEEFMASFCDACFPRRPVSTPIPPAVPSPGMMPLGPVNYIMMGSSQNGGSFSIVPNPSSGSLSVSWNPFSGPPNATPAPVSPPNTAAGAPAAAATTAAPAAAAPAAPAATAVPGATAAPDAAAAPAAQAAPAAGRK